MTRIMMTVVLLVACKQNEAAAPAAGSGVADRGGSAATGSAAGSGSAMASGSAAGSGSAMASGSAAGSGSAAQPPRATPPKNTHWDYNDSKAAAMLADESIGGVAPGSSLADVLTILGEPTKKLVFKHEEGTREKFRATGVWKSGMVIELGADTADGVPWIVSIACIDTCAFKTKKGLGLGSTPAEVKAAYGAAAASDDFMQHVAGTHGYESVEDAKKEMFVIGGLEGMSFQFKKGKVFQIYWGWL